MTNIRSTTTQLHDFFLDKEQIRSYLEQLKDNTNSPPLTQSTLQHIEQIEHRWQNYPIFTRSLAPYLEELQQYSPQQPTNAHPPFSPSLQKPQLKLVSPSLTPSDSPPYCPTPPPHSAIHPQLLPIAKYHRRTPQPRTLNLRHTRRCKYWN